MKLDEKKEQIEPKRLNIIEGSYSLHPYFGNIYDLKFFLEIEEEQQLANIRKRDGEEKLEHFKDEWIPKENAYFDKFDVSRGCIRSEWLKKSVLTQECGNTDYRESSGQC